MGLTSVDVFNSHFIITNKSERKKIFAQRRQRRDNEIQMTFHFGWKRKKIPTVLGKEVTE